eukprot:3504762-Pleurochrysis_carterae.AAC.3
MCVRAHAPWFIPEDVRARVDVRVCIAIAALCVLHALALERMCEHARASVCARAHETMRAVRRNGRARDHACSHAMRDAADQPGRAPPACCLRVLGMIWARARARK